MKGNIMDILDTIDLGSRDNWQLRADLVIDIDSTTDSTVTADQAAAFNNGDWGYAGIIVTASWAGRDMGSDSIWAVEYGTMPVESVISTALVTIDPLRDEGGSLDYYRADLIDNAIADASMALTSLIDEAIDSSINTGLSEV